MEEVQNMERAANEGLTRPSVGQMTSCSDGEAEKEAASPQNLVVKLIKQEDQLGQTRWTTWSEVKLEPPDDYENSNLGIVEDRGMEWVPVKEEPPEEIGAYASACLNGMDTERSEKRHDIVGTSADNAARVAANQSTPSTSEAMSALVNKVIASAFPPQVSMDDVVNSAGASTAMVAPEMCTVNGTMTTSSQTQVDNNPPHVSNAVVSQSQEAASISATTKTPVTLSSLNALGLDALKIQSPRVNFVAVPNMPGEAGNHNNATLQVTEEDMGVTDLASSQLTVIDDQSVVEGLVDVVVAVSSTSPSTSTIKLMSKRADQHAHRKGKRAKKLEKVPAKKAAHAVKKTHRKKRSRPPNTTKNLVNVADNVDTISWSGRPSRTKKNHMDVVVDSSDIVVSKPKKVKLESSKTKEKGQTQEAASTSATTKTPITVSSPHVLGLDVLKIQSPPNAPGKSGNHNHNNATWQVTEEDMDVTDLASSQLTVIDDQSVVEGLEDVVVAVSSTAPPTSTIKLMSKRADRHAHQKGKSVKKSEKVPAKKAAHAVKKMHRKKRDRPPKNHVNVADNADIISRSPSQLPKIKKKHMDVVVNSADVVVSKPKRAKLESSETKEKGMFPLHPTLGKRLKQGSSTSFNLYRLALLLPNEDAAVDFGQNFNLLPRFRFCPRCGQRLDKMYRIMRQGKRPLFRFQCNKQPCKLGKNQVPLRWGTKFVSSNLSLRKAIILDYCFVKKYDIPTARSESAMLECEDSDRMVSTSTETVVDFYNHCRETCAFFLMSLPPIGGLGYTVELFESFFVGAKSYNEGGSKSHKVHAFQGLYILAGVCIENNDVLFAVTENLDPNNILPLLQTKIALGTHVRTSSCKAYTQLKKFGYEHTVVKDTQLFVHNDLNFSGCSNVTQAGTMRPLAFHRRSGTFNLHLAEYLWRRKHRDSSDLFISYLETVAAMFPVNMPVAEGDEQAPTE